MEEKSGFKWEIVEYILTMLGFAGIQQVIGFFKGGKIKAGLAEVVSHVATSGASDPQPQASPYGVFFVQTLVEMNTNDDQRQALQKLAECLKGSIVNNKDDRIVKILTNFLKSEEVKENAKKLTDLINLVSSDGSGLSFDEVMELAEKDPLQALERAEKEAKEKIEEFKKFAKDKFGEAKEKALKFFKKKTVLIPMIFFSVLFLIGVILFSTALIMCFNGSGK